MLIDKFKGLANVESITELERKVFKLDREYFIEKGNILASQIKPCKCEVKPCV